MNKTPSQNINKNPYTLPLDKWLRRGPRKINHLTKIPAREKPIGPQTAEEWKRGYPETQPPVSQADAIASTVFH